MVAVVLVLGGCSGRAPSSPELEAVVAKEAATQPADLVDLTVYFRQGRGPGAFLIPVVREVPVGAELARTALELLLEGPGPDDPKGVQSAVPTTTRIRDFGVQGTTAEVDLSGEIIADAASVGRRPEHELLALAAIANTLTEFPEITRVALTVEGQPGGRFWGGWGLPDVLVRDDSVIAPESGAAVTPDLATFSHRVQKLGQRDRVAQVTSIRIRPRSTYLRVTLELSGANGNALLGAPPAASARRTGEVVRVAVAATAAEDLAGAQTLDDPQFGGADVEIRQTPPLVSVTVRPNKPSKFALQALTDPARVVLDIRR